MFLHCSRYFSWEFKYAVPLVRRCFRSWRCRIGSKLLNPEQNCSWFGEKDWIMQLWVYNEKQLVADTPVLMVKTSFGRWTSIFSCLNHHVCWSLTPTFQLSTTIYSYLLVTGCNSEQGALSIVTIVIRIDLHGIRSIICCFKGPKRLVLQVFAHLHAHPGAFGDRLLAPSPGNVWSLGVGPSAIDATRNVGMNGWWFSYWLVKVSHY